MNQGSTRRRRMAPYVVALLLAAQAGSASAGSVTYSYDNLGRLAQAVYSNGVVITYSYDAAGNRSSVVTSGA